MGRGRAELSPPAPPHTAEVGVVDGLTEEAEGVVHGGKTAFVAGALPGETVSFRRVRRHKQHDEALLLEVLTPSPERREPRCPHFGVCGGCALQHLGPVQQLQTKEGQLRAALERIGRVMPERWLEPLQGPQWAYRRRARLGARFVHKLGRSLVGFRERFSSHVAAIGRCEVLAAPAGELVQPLAELLTALSIRERIPQIEVAVADNATDLVIRVLSPPSEADLERLRAFEAAHGVRLYLQPKGLSSVARLDGRPGEALYYELPQFDLRYEFAPTDFVQINAEVNAALVGRAVELLGLTPQSRVLDLFCGLGNFTLALARRAAWVLGVEGDATLVQRARHNAALNGIGNAEFQAADLATVASLPDGWPGAGPKGEAGGFTEVLLDPPRAGARDVMRTIARIAPRSVLYISCHPGSLARDLGILVHEHGFRLRAAGVLDMFPHTTHVESLALLSL
ncbi:MAG TPA: 23S rRNA (uracil(1939)-C(5))-methyltransferase RlmD [Steroidobacteraceae bacterium]|nr:23S rRNA (uracil(1939)-C(5))-methyltransferase RlmD [Steroidobacteraceae bacterium]